MAKFRKKNFFREFSRIFEILKNFQMRFKKIHPHEFCLNIAHSKEEIILFQKMKKFGGGVKGVEQGQISL